MEKEEKLRYILHNLDWFDILSKAINHRKTSWKPDPVIEWRNASDEVCMAVINALEDKQVLEDMYTKVERLRRVKDTSRENHENHSPLPDMGKDAVQTNEPSGHPEDTHNFLKSEQDAPKEEDNGN